MREGFGFGDLRVLRFWGLGFWAFFRVSAVLGARVFSGFLDFGFTGVLLRGYGTLGEGDVSLKAMGWGGG